jgi:hypothetical protein
VTEMTKHIRVRASGGTHDEDTELAAFTPAFLWLLRDFYLRLEEDGHAVGGLRRPGWGWGMGRCCTCRWSAGWPAAWKVCLTCWFVS